METHLMTLREYMQMHKLTYLQMAAILDCSRQQIGRTLGGKKISRKFARQIERATKGLVSEEEALTCKN